ncbi:recombinase family protein [Silvimonas sp. JCM 19000]
MRIGYLLDESDHGHEHTRLELMRAWSCQAVFMDLNSHSRRQLSMALASLISNDTLVIHNLDTAGLGAYQLLCLLEQLDRRGASLEVVALGLSSATAEGQRTLMNILIQQLRSERPARAKPLGKQRGRRPKLNASAVRLLAESLRRGMHSRDVAKDMGVSIATLYRYKRLIEDGGIAS